MLVRTTPWRTERSPRALTQKGASGRALGLQGPRQGGAGLQGSGVLARFVPSWSGEGQGGAG